MIRDLALIVALVLALALPGSGRETFRTDAEYRNAVVLREALATGARGLHGAPYTDTPSYFALATLAAKARGAVTPFEARFPSIAGLALAALATLLAARAAGASPGTARIAAALFVVAPHGWLEWRRALALPLHASLAIAATSLAIAALARLAPRHAARPWLAALLWLVVSLILEKARGATDLLAPTAPAALLVALALEHATRWPRARAIARTTGLALALASVLALPVAWLFDQHLFFPPALRFATGLVPGGLALALAARAPGSRLTNGPSLGRGLVALLAFGGAAATPVITSLVSLDGGRKGVGHFLAEAGFRPGQVAVHESHLEQLCWQWAPTPTEPVLILAERAQVLAWLRAAPPGTRVAIVRQKELREELDLDGPAGEELDRPFIGEVGTTDRAALVLKPRRSSPAGR